MAAATTIPIWLYLPQPDRGAQALLAAVRAQRARRDRERAALARSLKLRFPEDDQ